MNERIIELVSQADENFQLALVPAEIVEKFAELIILECAELVEYNSKGAGRDIREHFGVER